MGALPEPTILIGHNLWKVGKLLDGTEGFIGCVCVAVQNTLKMFETQICLLPSLQALSLFGSRAVHTSPLLSAVEKSAVEIEKVNVLTVK